MNISAPLNRLEESELETIRLQHGSHHAMLTLQGAQLVSCFHGGKERFWLSPRSFFETGKSIRGGVPVCWPWFGAHPEDDARPAHGFARTAVWTLVDSGNTTEHAYAVLQLDSLDPAYPLQASYRIELSDAGIRMQLTSTNRGSSTVMLTEALHTYLPVSDIDNASLHGLKGKTYADKILDYARAVETKDAIQFDEPIDRVYFEAADQLQLVDVATGKITRISKRGSAATVVWNAGEQIAAGMIDMGVENFRSYVCVEAANALEEGAQLKTGESHTLEQWLSFQ